MRRSEQAIAGFKGVNDSLGHATGDLVFKEIGRRMKAGVTEGGFVARLRSEIEQAVSVNDASLAVRVSVGVAVFSDDGESMSELIRVADQRTYVNKAERKSGGASILARLM